MFTYFIFQCKNRFMFRPLRTLAATGLLTLLMALPLIARVGTSKIITLADGSQARKGELVVKLAPGTFIAESPLITREPALNERIRQYRVEQIDRAFPHLNGKKLRATDLLRNIFYFHMDRETDLAEAARVFTATPGVVYAEPRYIQQPEEIPNDPSWGQNSDLVHILAPQAWDIVKGDTSDVVVAVVDNGTQWQHPDLLANVWINPGEIPNNGIDDDNNGYIDDVHGWNFANNSNDPTGLPNVNYGDHGTPVAGTVAAVTNNGIGGASVSWNLTYLPVDGADAGGALSNTYQGIVYAASNGADVINCSWGRVGGFSNYEQDIINFAYNNGVLVVASAGNGGDDDIGDNNDKIPHYPSSYRHVLSVGATNKTDDIKPVWSNYGATAVQLFAPGVDIYVPYPGGYAWISGTSFSSPMTAGLAGLVKTIFPWMSNDDIALRLERTADKIDDVNPAFAGKLGFGRINAFHAVDPDYPVIRVVGTQINDSGGNGVINPDETIDVTLKVVSYYTDVPNASVTISENDDFVTLTSSGATISNLNANDTALVTFQFQTDANIPDGHQIEFTAGFQVGSYSVSDDFVLTAFADYLTFDNGVIKTSLTTQGNIGYTALGLGQSAGDGFVFRNKDYLYEAGIMIGNGIATISDCIRGTDGQTEDDDFRPAAGSSIQIVSPGSRTFLEGEITLVDSLAMNPIGIEVRQQSYLDTTAGNDNFMILKYTLRNLKSTALNNLYMGLFFDWNINTGRKDIAEYDSTRKMGVIQNLPTNGSRFLATKLLTDNAPVSYRSINNETELNDGFTILEKWNFLTGGIQTTEIIFKDVSTLLSQGPFSLPAGESITIGYAVIGAYSQAELESSADNAQLLWDGVVSGIRESAPPAPRRFILEQNFPNPFNPSTTIRYRLPGREKVELSVYNLLGQKVRTLTNAVMPAGVYRAEWDGRDDRGHPVASGVYLYRLKSGETVLTRKMVLLR